MTGTMKDRELAAFRNHNLGFVFQSFHLIPSLNVMDNVELPLIYRSHVSDKERKQMVREVLDRVGLSHRLRHMPAQLSGGQCQRVAVARAIVGNRLDILLEIPDGEDEAVYVYGYPDIRIGIRQIYEMIPEFA